MALSRWRWGEFDYDATRCAYRAFQAFSGVYTVHDTMNQRHRHRNILATSENLDTPKA
jgi:hypothetical protein